MHTIFPGKTLYAFMGTALLYLLLVTVISFPLTTVLKPLPILCLIVAVMQASCVPWARKTLIVALGFSMLGDILLTLPVSLQIELGLGAFLLAHCFYIVLFLPLFSYDTQRIAYFLPVILLVGLAAFVLVPNLGMLLVPVIVYACVLLTMVFCAFQVKTNALITALGALLFLSSDTTLAFTLFKYQQIDARIAIMLTYYAAQALLTWGLLSSYNPAFYGMKKSCNSINDRGLSTP